MAQSDDQRRPAGPNDPTRLIIRPSDSAATRVLPKSPAGVGAGPGGKETVLVHQEAGTSSGERPFDPVVGWLVVTSGPGRGEFCAVRYGQNSVGRGADQRIRIDFGDDKISRESHAFVIYDDQQRKYFVKDGGKSNLVRLNGAPVLAPSELSHDDVLALGSTELRFVAFCGSKFDWLDSDAAAKA